MPLIVPGAGRRSGSPSSSTGQSMNPALALYARRQRAGISAILCTAMPRIGRKGNATQQTAPAQQPNGRLLAREPTSAKSPRPPEGGEGVGERGVTHVMDELQGQNKSLDVSQAFKDSNIQEVLDDVDRELVGFQSVKTRIREIAAFLLVDRLRREVGLTADRPVLHMSFTGRPGTGKTTVAMRMARILHRLGHLRRDHLVVASLDDLVGQYVGHTAPRTKEVLKKAMGGVLLIDEAYYLYRSESERDYGQETIEILLQVMENQREDLVVILAGYKERMDDFFRSNPGMRSRVAHHLDFSDFTLDEVMQIAERMVAQQKYFFDEKAREAFREYIRRRIALPDFANARSIRNALDRIKLRQANRLYSVGAGVTKDDLSRIDAADILKSRVFLETPELDGSEDAARQGHS